jgi:phospholipase D1/2
LQSSKLFDEGRNCWRVAHARRAAFLVDADSYFKAFVAAARNAQRSILITGWDFHSRTKLPCGLADDDCELELGRFLNDLARRRRLRIHILIWDYPMVFGLDREWAPIYGLGWRPRRRIKFRYDNTHPVGASQHQKIVVIDDKVAFCGGIDLTCRRWDTCEHAPDNRLRVINGTPYPPFHDLTMVLEGQAAHALGDLVRERWRRATGQTLSRPPLARHEIWPRELAANVNDLDVAMSRTEPPTEGGAGVREVEHLYLDMIAAARRSIYIENQYFTADRIGAALAQRLAEPDGPEIVVVLRELSHGWLEELTMQNLRTRMIEKLRAADRYDRFRVFYPYITGLTEGTCIDVHSKMMVVDDDILRIGSANLANRSMGLDTECDITLEARGRADLQEAIRSFRATLLAEHLGCSPQEVRAAVAQTGSLRRSIERLHRDDRTLKPLVDLPKISATVLNMASVADPERPVDLNSLSKLFGAESESRERGPAWGKIAALAGAVAGLTTLWKFTPLAEVFDADRIAGWAQLFGSQWWAPLLTILAYTPAALTMFPRPLITLFAVIAFGPWLGFVYAMLGIELSAWLTFIAGRRLDRGTVRRIAGVRLNEIIQVLRRRGLLAITALRLVPLAPFAVEGVVAGAVHVKTWHFLLGTAIGVLPGTLTSTVFGDQLHAALQDPSQINYGLIGAVVLVLAAATWLVRRWLVASAATTSQHGVGRTRTA